MIQRLGRNYRVVSETPGRSFGTYDTLAEAIQHPRQIEMRKHLQGAGAWAVERGGAERR